MEPERAANSHGTLRSNRRRRLDFGLYGLTFGLFLFGVVASFRNHSKIGAALVIAAGASSIVFRTALASAQNQIDSSTNGAWGPARPTSFVLWGAGLVVAGLAWLVTK